ncbi:MULTISPECIES: transporter substrate-binding domain-containing protein [unclassified Vibrio]|uniref:response regulator n=1 Tax=unclassified Vibrio TaxID=2614977 RepID=UPI00159E1AA4|nr:MULTISPECIES: transporter substrate-binding domain-containing protein [unclassified Vibrio]NVN80617.1 transporter substrate-binding domain-containing protein [Vibrio sp. Scap16]QLE95573.1 transporter substrate-binding domain-containing protein [Vibrio sp. Scap24]
MWLLTGLCFYGSVSAAEVTDAQLNRWLDIKPTITFIALANHYPYSFIDDDGRVSGIIKDWAIDLEDRFGVHARFISVNSRVEAKAALLDGRGDVFPFQQFDPSEGGRFLASDPYVPYQVAVIVPIDNVIDTNLDQTHKRRIAMVNENIDLQKAGVQLNSIERVDFDNVIDAVRALGEGDVDGIVGEPITTMDLAKNIGVHDLTINYVLEHWKRLEASMVVRTDEEELLTLLNKQVATFDIDKKNKILSKWLDSSPYRVPLKGVFGFGNPPYMYPDSTAVGLEHDIIQRALNDMGYKLGDVVTLPPSAARKAIDNNNSISFVSGVQFDDPEAHFLSDSVLDVEFVPVSLVRRDLKLQSQKDLSVGALLFDDTSPIKKSVETLRDKLDIDRVEDYESLESAFSQLRAQNVDVLMVERRVLEWFVTNTRFIEMAELQLHDSYKVTYPIYVDFKTEELRDGFNAAIEDLKLAEDGLSTIIDTHVEGDLSQVLKKANVIAQISAYFIVNDRFEELTEVFEIFDTDSSFQVITAQADNNNRPIKAWYIGNLVDDIGEKKNTSHFSSVTKVASYRTKGGTTNSGSMTFYFDTKSLEKKHVYFPAVEQFSSFGDAAKRYIADIYQANNLTGEILNLSQAEREWVKNNPDVRIGIDPDSLPYEAVSSTGEYIGMIDDYLTLVEQKTGLRIQHVDVANWSETRSLVDHDEVDVVSAAQENRSLGDNVKPVKSFFSSRLALASRRDVSSLVLEEATGWKIGILRNAANTDAIVDKYPNVDWVLVDATATGLTMLDDESLDGMIDTVDVLNYLIDSYGHREVGIIGRLDFFLSPTLHVTKSEPLLYSILDKAIANISAEEHQKISAKWAAPKAIERVDYQLVYTISVFSLVILLLIIFWNRKLAKQISIANEATEALKKAQNQLYNMLNSSPIAAAVVFEEQVRYANDTAKRLFVVEGEELDDIDVSAIHDSLTVREEVHKELKLNGKVENRELVLRKSDGTRFVALVSYYLFELDGEIATLFWAFDISEMKYLNEQLAEEKERADLASQAKSEFLANMSHEIRTPMNAIIGLSYLAMGEIVNPVARTYVEKVHRSGHSLLSIINDILDFSKIEAGQLFIDNIPFNSLTTFHDVIELMDSKAAEKQLSLSMSIDPELDTPLRGDPLRLFQVVLNLIGNAIKFTAKGSVALTVAHVRSSEGSLTMKVSVTDTGIGISDENLHKLFEAFSQADTTTTRRFGGTGLGLNISQKLVHAMGSKITVESVLGQGSEFSFDLTLPRATHEELAQFKAQELQLDYQIEFKGQKVLLVEDNDLNQDLALAFFTRSKLHADLAENGKEAVELAQSNDYDMIFMDLQMPIMDGFEATSLIREFNKEVPIIAMSANVFADAKQRAREAGVTDFLDKPVAFDKATSLISKYIVPELLVEGKPSANASVKSQQTDNMNLSHEVELGSGSASLPIFSKFRFEQLTNHDGDLQAKVLNRFCQGAPEIMAETFDNLTQLEWVTLERNLHTLKSMAASIGGLRLAELLSDLESKAHNKACDEQDLKQGNSGLAELIQVVESEFEAPCTEGAEINLGDSSDSSSITSEQRSKLLSLLDAYDNDATQYVSELLIEYPHSDVLKAVRSALENYDFERANEVLNASE